MKKQWLCWYLMMGALHFVTYSAHASPLEIVVACSVCGTVLSPSEIQLNIKKGMNHRKFLCRSCWNSKGKGDSEQSIALSPGVHPSFSPNSFFSYEDHIGGTVSSSLGDEAHYGSEALKLAADRVGDWEDWEVEDDVIPIPKKKLRKKVIYGKRGSVVKKQPQRSSVLQKNQPVAAASTIVDQSSQSITPFPFHMPRWWYFFPQTPGTPRHSELQVFYEDQHVFGTVSEHPAQELWCQGSKAVIVTDDGYTFFDMEKKERIFFSTKQELEAYSLKEGISYEFKIVLEEKREQSADGLDDILKRMYQSLDDYSKGMNESFSQSEKEYCAKISQINARYEAAIRKISERSMASQSTVQQGESRGNSLEDQFSKITIS